jgi:nicotinamidase-related amidase
MKNDVPATALPTPVTIDARPFAYTFAPGKAALVIIDMQRDFIEPGGFGDSLGNDVSQLAAAIAPTKALLDAWRARGWPIVHTRESHLPTLADCPPSKRSRGNPALRIGDHGPMGRLLIRGEPGCDIVAELVPLPGEVVIDKPGKGAFHATPLQGRLTAFDVTHLVFAGVTTEVCVQTTMREANDRGYDSLLVEEATASYFPHFKASAIEMIVAQGGIVGWAAPLATVLAALPAAPPVPPAAATPAASTASIASTSPSPRG